MMPSDMQGSGYEFSAVPKVVNSKKKYRDPYGKKER